MKLKNTLILHNGYVEIICEGKDYKHSTLVDTDDLKLFQNKIRITKTGYAYESISGKSISCIILACETNKHDTYIDHINGNTLDNRRSNIRVCTPSENARNRHSFVRNNTGVVGIAYRENKGYKYFRVSLVDNNRDRCIKQFNINKLGREEAFFQAQDFLLKKKKEFGYIV